MQGLHTFQLLPGERPLGEHRVYLSLDTLEHLLVFEQGVEHEATGIGDRIQARQQWTQTRSFQDGFRIFCGMLLCLFQDIIHEIGMANGVKCSTVRFENRAPSSWARSFACTYSGNDRAAIACGPGLNAKLMFVSR